MNQFDQQVCQYVQSLDCASRRVQLAIKGILDVVLASLALVVLSPCLGLLVVLIRLDSPGAAIYRQRRLERGGRVFTMYKLRSMHDGCAAILNPDGSTRVLQDDVRLTRLGKCMRTLGLDELPQLLNVLRGEMSLVGPRPDQDFHLQWYGEGDYRKLAMRPGITSLGQVSGRNAIPWADRMSLEITYVERFSLWLDLKILVRTLGVVLRGIGASNPDGEVSLAPGIPSREKAESKARYSD